MKLILATQSPFKIEAFKKLGLIFETCASDIDESKYSGEDPEKLVAQLAIAKAEAVSEKYPDALVIGNDTIGFFENKILEKPKNISEARNRLKRLSGKKHLIITGNCIIYPHKTPIIKIVKTEVQMRELSEQEIDKYLAEDPNVTKICIGYDPGEHLSASFVKSISGSYHNLISGMPLETLAIELYKLM